MTANSVSRSRSQFSFLFVAIAVGLVMTWLQNLSPVSAASRVDPASVAADPCREAMGNVCDESVTVRNAVDEMVLSAASVCVDVGYLCTELEALGSQRILRWPENTGRLRIRVPAPPGSSP